MAPSPGNRFPSQLQQAAEVVAGPGAGASAVRGGWSGLSAAAQTLIRSDLLRNHIWDYFPPPLQISVNAFFFLKLSAAGLLNPSGSLARKREPCKGGEPCLKEPRGNQVFQGSCLNNLRSQS